jgi:REP element-mobilizing transposase RayT
MPRAPRLQIAGGIYHVVVRGVRRTPIFLDDTDREVFLRELSRVVTKDGWVCIAYCLMTNHVHLVVETPRANISIGMQHLNSGYAQHFNRRHGLQGHAFERRFWSEVIESDAQLLEVVRYVVLNPVRAGVCAEPGIWEWSSYRVVAGGASRGPVQGPVAPMRTLQHFESGPRRSEAVFVEFVTAARPGARGP